MKKARIRNGFSLSFARKYEKQLLNTGVDAVKTASRNVIHKAGEFLRNNIADAVIKTNNDKIMKTDKNPRNIEEVITPLEK